MGGSILVVEDEAAIRDLLAANLQRAGYKVMCAGERNAALLLKFSFTYSFSAITWF